LTLEVLLCQTNFMRLYRAETKQESMGLVIEEYIGSGEVTVKLRIRKAARIEA
jgi:hypothetical protein